ncbi:hypothetical protein LGZ99_19655 [Photorhabdus temperata]|uniref:hypothetical protein n=1 Tax=Photorhabdus temperata TaxID=574560 RepID=UPI0021D4C310|nr:hypothetical protein [Photorhabdus temperata]MCT8349345.1 hypothetical protein [Photorhabdus temperata]
MNDNVMKLVDELHCLACKAIDYKADVAWVKSEIIEDWGSNDLSNYLKAVSNPAVLIDLTNEIKHLCDKLTIADNNLIDSECHNAELKKKLAEYESLIRAFCNDDDDWHKLADSKNELISVLFHKLLSVAEELKAYKEMEPVAWQDILTGKIYTELPKSDETRYLALLYHPNK